MNKKQAIEEFVKRDFSAVPQNWVEKIANLEGGYPNLPIWGTMWLVDDLLGEELMEKSRVMASSIEDIDLDEIEKKEGLAKRKKIEKAIKNEDWFELEMYYDEEMGYERSVLDVDGNPTSMFIYEIGDEYVVGINGAGWNFYDGVWDRIYDTIGLKWHKEEDGDETK